MDNRTAQGRFIGITVEALLRPCEIYPVRTASGNGYVWEWSAPDPSIRSQHAFDMFFDCLNDARMNGFEPHFMDGGTTDIEVVPVTAPA
jgi:hypothetical protein